MEFHCNQKQDFWFSLENLKSGFQILVELQNLDFSLTKTIIISLVAYFFISSYDEASLVVQVKTKKGQKTSMAQNA